MADLRTFFVRLSRQQFRELPLRFVLVPTLDGPRLIFPPEHQAQANVLQADLDVYRERYARTRKRKKRMQIVGAVRLAHLWRVRLACGYSWPTNPPGWIEFAPDA